MVLALLIGGIGAVVAGLLAILFGFQIELSFGNTLIMAGAVGVSTGMILLGLAAVVVELRAIGRRLGAGVPAEPRVRPMLPPLAATGAAQEGRLAAGDHGGLEPARAEPGLRPPPWQEPAPVRERPRAEAPSEPETAVASGAPTAPATRQRRNLLFASTSRRERERAQVRGADAPPVEDRPALGEPQEAGEVPPVTFDDAWPKPERRPSEPAPWRPARKPSTLSEPSPAAAPEPPAAGSGEGQPEATVLKSGVVDGMAYSLYSDGSIEAQMPEGMMRFASIDELRSHLDQKS